MAINTLINSVNHRITKGSPKIGVRAYTRTPIFGYFFNFRDLLNFGSFAILSLLWLGFGAALLFNRAILDSIWQSFQALPLIAQLGIGLLLLPLVLGLWIWQTPWLLWLRLILVLGLGIATIYTFFPKQA